MEMLVVVVVMVVVEMAAIDSVDHLVLHLSVYHYLLYEVHLSLY